MKKKLYIFIMILIIEIFVFNFKFWRTITNTPLDINVTLNDGTELEYNHPYLIDDNFSININCASTEINTIYLDATFCDVSSIDYSNRFDINNVCQLQIYATDEGNENEYLLTEKIITSYIKKSEYMSLEPFGKIDTIKVTMDSALGNYVIIHDVAVNPNVPMCVSLLRIVGMLMVYLIVKTFLFESYTTSNLFEKYDKPKTILAFLLVNIFLVLMLYVSKTDNCSQEWEYQILVHSLLQGKLDLNIIPNSDLLSMANPYDAYARSKEGVLYLWDTALFDGKYYVYFGIVPVLFLFLPYYLLTGQDLSCFQAEIVIIILTSAAAFMLTDELRRKFFPQISHKMQLLFSVMFSVLSGNIIIVLRSAIYYVAIGEALMLIMFGISFWMSASRGLAENNSISNCRIKGSLGSLLMALAVGSRPQFAMASFLIFPIFDWIIADLKNNKKNIVLLIIPYVPIALMLMWYNEARFGSPFNFGANYNLTGYDMVHMGIHPSRILVGISYYLFSIPNLCLEFPYIIPSAVYSNYSGYMVSESVIGGMLFLLPILIVIPLYIYREHTLKSSRYIFNYIKLNIIITLIIIAADSIFAGILMRYQIDMRIYLLLAASSICYTELNNAYIEGVFFGFKIKKFDLCYKIISFLILLSLLLGLVSYGSPYENCDQEYNLMRFAIMKNLISI